MNQNPRSGGRLDPLLTGSWRIGVDVGGTFTDLALVDVNGTVRVFKVASNIEQPALGVLNVIEHAAHALGLSTNELVERCTLFVHGSTIATNALLEGKGARVGLLTTKGFRDSLEIRRGIRENAWQHRTPYPPVLVPRYLRRPVDGRIDRNGVETKALNTEDLASAMDYFEVEEVESVAVCLFNSFLNDAHERTVQGQLWENSARWVSSSSVIAPIMGEYERTSTTVVSAYVAPRVAAYLTELNDSLVSLGLPQPMLVVQSSGGVQNVHDVIEHPGSLLLSGPAAATGALKMVAQGTGESHLISMEVGGTSCDVMLLRDGAVAVTDAFEIAGYHVGLSAVEIHTIGAGGGTLAGCDKAGMMWVGPQGAGASPGPACYGRGGKLPTITDAELILGRLAPGPFADGSFSLDPAKAYRAVEQEVAGPLGIEVEEAAAGMVRLVVQKLTQAIESVTIAQGHDPREFVLVAGGGAGPMLASAVARALKCKRVCVLSTAGAMCALGMSLADVRHEFSKVHLARFTADALSSITSLMSGLMERGRKSLRDDGFDADKMRFEAYLSLRHPGQIGTVRIPVAPDMPIDIDAVKVDFGESHQRLYGYRQSDSALDVCAVQVIAVGDSEAPRWTRPESFGETSHVVGQREVYYETEGGRVITNIYKSPDLRPGERLVGPVIIEELTTTVVVYPGDFVEADESGNYSIHLHSGEV